MKGNMMSSAQRSYFSNNFAVRLASSPPPSMKESGRRFCLDRLSLFFSLFLFLVARQFAGCLAD
jgi:hypothetical protein